MHEFRVWCDKDNDWEKDPCFINEKGMLFAFHGNGELYPMDFRHTIQFSTTLDVNNEPLYAGDFVSVDLTDISSTFGINSKIRKLIDNNIMDELLFAIEEKDNVFRTSMFFLKNGEFLTKNKVTISTKEDIFYEQEYDLIFLKYILQSKIKSSIIGNIFEGFKNK